MCKNIKHCSHGNLETYDTGKKAFTIPVRQNIIFIL
ncbi:hypothetical protein BSUW23_11680 [Bacillus spizizenii str. W23]|uniref:Uncharacterized protein n=1 Tax=Bacillus spizizenii (strain ATCC 23059 / NRRL B-14472 / W23) TaxID=655816 RepID=E0U2P1_BACSH|nr:hypothetical protein BSUW23_11680 [Bacillus spizizenii str. W23]